MMMRTVLIGVLVLLCAGVATVRAQPATRSAAAEGPDAATQDILNDIDAHAATAEAHEPAIERNRSDASGPAGSFCASIRTQYLPALQVVWPALLASAALAVAGGVTGLFMVLRREALVALSIPQVVTLGAAIGLRLAWPTLPPAVGMVAVALVLIAWSNRRRGGGVLLPALYIAGVCLSILIIADAGEHLIEVQNLFTGIDVAVGERQTMVVSALLLLAAGVCALLWRRWLLLAQAPAAAELAGLHPVKWNAVFLGLLATVLVLATNALGTVMVISLLFLPAAAVLPWIGRIPRAMAASAGVALLAVLGGFVVSVQMRWPLSQSVGGVGFVLFVGSYGAARCIS